MSIPTVTLTFLNCQIPEEQDLPPLPERDFHRMAEEAPGPTDMTTELPRAPQTLEQTLESLASLGQTSLDNITALGRTSADELMTGSSDDRLPSDLDAHLDAFVVY